MTAPTGIDPTRTALLLMDFQPVIVDSAPDADGLLQRATTARQVARKHGVRVGYVRVAFGPQDYASIPPRNKSFAALASGGRLLDGSPEAAIHPALRPEDDDFVVTKTRVGAFSTTNLSTHLNGRNIDTVVLAGISTSGVVLSTVRDAADRDYRIVVLADCCADPRPKVHRVLLDDVFPRQADVIDHSALAAILG